MELMIAKAPAVEVYIAFGIALYVWHVATSIAGVFIADYFAVSDFSPDLKNDLKKMAICSFMALSLFLSLLYITHSAIVFLIYVLFFVFSLKIAYLGSNHGFLLIVLGTNMAGLIGFAFMVKWLGLPGIFFLYLVFAIAFLIRQQKKGNREKQ